MTVEQRLNVVETDLETVRQLLVSAASYAESANRGLDRLTAAQAQSQSQVDQLTAAQTQTQSRVEQLVESQTQTQTQLNQLTERVEQFIFHSQRLVTQHAERLERTEGQTERLEAIVRMLNRNYEAQQSQMREFQVTTNAALERIDRVLDYLMRQSGGSGAG
ncbi:hypothetical protein [Argonema antarcticum]|uniref:hypothetical protein n=1 Tax=Argonema antarcticum TaxID=2942763 RepID=UPI002012ED17|nr:hypothetical protein [Argonema antarcticum]MCL1475694.1 hypothetical protein [Argonema antarcticum A004/B2]